MPGLCHMLFQLRHLSRCVLHRVLGEVWRMLPERRAVLQAWYVHGSMRLLRILNFTCVITSERSSLSISCSQFRCRTPCALQIRLVTLSTLQNSLRFRFKRARSKIFTTTKNDISQTYDFGYDNVVDYNVEFEAKRTGKLTLRLVLFFFI